MFTRRNAVTMAIGLGSQVLRHPQLCPIVDALEINFVHQRLNQLQSPTAAALRVFLFILDAGVLTVLTHRICRHDAATRNSNDQFIIFHAKPLINFAVRTKAVLRSIDARFN